MSSRVIVRVLCLVMLVGGVAGSAACQGSCSGSMTSGSSSGWWKAGVLRNSGFPVHAKVNGVLDRKSVV